MDRSLDELIADRPQRRNNRSGARVRHRSSGPYDGVRKSRVDSRDFDRDWVHDKFDENDDSRSRPRQGRLNYYDRPSPQRESAPAGAKLRIDNLHYDLAEEDLESLFGRIGRVQGISIRYDRAGRSMGTAFVTYEHVSSAKTAIHNFDGANANGQPIRLTLVPTPQAAPTGRSRNPFDTAQRPSKSLFDRITTAPERSRSASPGRPRPSDVSRPAPEHIDRYVPGQRSRSPLRLSRPGGRGQPRRKLDGRREDHSSSRGEQSRKGMGRDGRPRKTQEELDAEMEDYWGAREDAAMDGGGPVNGTEAVSEGLVVVENPQPATTMDDDDVMMIE